MKEDDTRKARDTPKTAETPKSSDKKAALEDKMLSQTYPEHARYAARTWCFFSGKKV